MKIIEFMNFIIEEVGHTDDADGDNFIRSMPFPEEVSAIWNLFVQYTNSGVKLFLEIDQKYFRTEDWGY